MPMNNHVQQNSPLSLLLATAQLKRIINFSFAAKCSLKKKDYGLYVWNGSLNLSPRLRQEGGAVIELEARGDI
ncbi:conserved hypothetical protein [Ricinus communis]|uniref:Uncharacterized protein n=1 Tax=Ricinus communis TaxID=3988 RepID=B9RKP9_RICCO|nr:conserved hypothetical protein [Ricinus communis]